MIHWNSSEFLLRAANYLCEQFLEIGMKILSALRPPAYRGKWATALAASMICISVHGQLNAEDAALNPVPLDSISNLNAEDRASFFVGVMFLARSDIQEGKVENIEDIDVDITLANYTLDEILELGRQLRNGGSLYLPSQKEMEDQLGRGRKDF